MWDADRGWGYSQNSECEAWSLVAVFGAGCVGLGAVMAAKIRDAQIIIAVDNQSERLDLARDLGATHTFRGDDPCIRSLITDLCGSKLGVDFAVDCSGAAPVIENMIATLGIREKAASIGALPPGKNVSVEVFPHITMGCQRTGCHQGDCTSQKVCLHSLLTQCILMRRKTIPYLMEQHAQGKFPLEKLIKVYDSKDFLQAFQDMKDGNVLKPVLKWV